MDLRILEWKVISPSLIFAFLVSLTSSSTPWPYLQVYPAVNESDGHTPLYFALMLSFGGDFKSIGALPGVQIALDYINSEPSLLPGYSLHYTLTDSQCNRTVAIDSFFREMNPSPTKVGWVGSGCSVATEPTAELSQYFNITQLSCASTSPAPEDKEIGYYFQLLSSSTILSHGFFGVIEASQWRRVSLITQNEVVFVKMMDDLKKLLSNAGIDYTERVFASEEGITGLGTEPFDPDSRVFVWAMYGPHARALACEAYKRGLRYPRNLFLTLGWYGDDWLLEPTSSSELSCTLEDRIRTLNYAVAIKSLAFNTNKTLVTEGELSLTDFEEQYMAKISSPINDGLRRHLALGSGTVFPYSQSCHEATLTLAYALQRTSEDLVNNQTLNEEAARQASLPDGETFTLANFSYTNSAIVGRMLYHLINTDFLGITGNRVRFTDDRTRPSDTLIISQYHPGDGDHEVVDIGLVSVETNNFSRASGVSEKQIWPEGVPSDGIPERVIVTVATPLTVIYSILAVLGLCFAVFCLVFNYMYRKKKLMVLSGTCLNYLVCAGSIIFFINIIAAVIPSTDPIKSSILCNFVLCTASIAFTLSNITIALKVIKIWYINNRPKLYKKMAIQDMHILVAVMILVGLDVVIIAFYLLILGVKGDLEAALIPSREKPMELIGPTQKVIKNYFYVCFGAGPSALFSLLIGFKAFVMIVALIFSLRTHKLKQNVGRDDSKYIAATVYVMNIVSVVVVASNVSLLPYVNARPAVLSIAQFFGSTVVLCLVFVPKMVAIAKTPNETAATGISPHKYIVTTQDEHQLEGLRQRVRELQASLKVYGGTKSVDDKPRHVVTGSSGVTETSADTGIDVQSCSGIQASID